MKAVYKRELASYFKSMIGYVFRFFIFLIVGIILLHITFLMHIRP